MKTNFQLLPPEGQAAALEVIKARLSSPGMSAAGSSEVKKITEIFMGIYGIELREEKATDVGKDGTAQSASELTGQSKPKLALTDGAPESGGFPDAAKIQAKQFKVHKAEMNISVNVDKDNLDKLEAQLKRIAALSQPLKIKDGQIFIKEAVINSCTTTRSAIEGQIAFQNWQEAHNQHARDAVVEVINKELQPGGVIHQALRR
ncbi:hypothetical protein [Serratia sp. JSRIV004]|uniref:hypothetical protein n=1 Tax=Serratia sp. JSRIV004 TaxID=2831895 RepID=UPI001CBBB718|nr:hypothetical protein [Serratia sp. JSRIV004]UAN58894.1 hypothetical protein KGP21_07560 [Serratia sp. JSRIV004]